MLQSGLSLWLVHLLIPQNESRDHGPKCFSQIKQALFSVGQGYLCKAGFGNIASATGKGKVYIVPKTARLGSFQGSGDVPRNFGYIEFSCTFQNHLAEHLEVKVSNFRK